MTAETRKKSKRNPLADAASHIAAAVPTNWLDSILTGPKAVVGKPPWGCPDVERILWAVRERVTAAALAELPKYHRAKPAALLVREEGPDNG